MALQTRRKRLRQRGGSEDIVYQRYTTRPQRLEWITATYPLGNVVVNAFKDINWASYKYEGPGLIYTDLEIRRGKSFRFEDTVQMTATCQTIPYVLLGGAACELWNKKYPKVADLHKTTEPTADIDIKLANLNCVINEDAKNDSIEKLNIEAERHGSIEKQEDYDFSIHILTDDGDYSLQYDNFSRWIFNEAVKVARNIAPSFSDDFFTTPDTQEMNETRVADLSETAGPILITRSKLTDINMIKIQLSTKLARGTKHADHILELIIPTDDPFYMEGTHTLPDLRNEAVKIDTIFISDAFELLSGQLKAIKGRAEADEEIKYKLINHYGRVLYLSKLCKYIADRGETKYNLNEYNFEKVFLNPVLDGDFNPKRFACPPPIGCSAATYLAPLCNIRQFKNRCAKDDVQTILYPQKVLHAARVASAAAFQARSAARNKTAKAASQWWNTSSFKKFFKQPFSRRAQGSARTQAAGARAGVVAATRSKKSI